MLSELFHRNLHVTNYTSKEYYIPISKQISPKITASTCNTLHKILSPKITAYTCNTLHKILTDLFVEIFVVINFPVCRSFLVQWVLVAIYQAHVLLIMYTAGRCNEMLISSYFRCLNQLWGQWI